MISRNIDGETACDAQIQHCCPNASFLCFCLFAKQIKEKRFPRFDRIGPNTAGTSGPSPAFTKKAPQQLLAPAATPVAPTGSACAIWQTICGTKHVPLPATSPREPRRTATARRVGTARGPRIHHTWLTDDDRRLDTLVASRLINRFERLHPAAAQVRGVLDPRGIALADDL
jgi:hypothetical protein